MDFVTKDYPVSDTGTSDEYPNGSFEVVLSAPTLDRDGEIVDAKAFEPLPDHITFDTDHSMTCDSVVGSGVPSYANDGRLLVKGSYASDGRSQIIRTKVFEGHIRTASVTFMAATRVNDAKGIPHVVKAELLNGTFTPVPANREAVVLTAKAIVAKVGARNSKTDAEMIQGAHDYMAALGAACEGKSLRLTDRKSIVGSLEATRDRVQDALSDAYPGWTYVRGVLPTEVIFERYAEATGESMTCRQSYTDDGSVVTLTGVPVEVDVMEIVTPDADADGMCAGCGAPCCASCAMCESCAACPTCVACGCPDCCATCGACACPACCAACVSLAAGCCAGVAHCESCAGCTACCPCSCAACCATCPTCSAYACPTCCAANAARGVDVTKSAVIPADAAAKAAASTGKAADPDEIRARLAVIENAARLAFG